jgi:hypothetical protein
VDHVPAVDNGPAEYHDERVRVERGGKCGYADPFGKLIVEAVWDGCQDFDDDGKAKVCKGCKPEREGEHTALKGGEWSCIDPRGRAVDCPK